MKKLLLSIAFLLPGMGMMAQTQVTTAEGSAACTEMAGRSRGQGVRTEPDAGTSLRRYELRYEDQQRGLPLP